MRFLLDTQALIWFLEDNVRLSSHAKKLIENPENEIFVSQFSFVEIAIKETLNKIVVKNGLASLMEESQLLNIQVLGIKKEYILAYRTIPLLEKHRDPFDRMIMASALVEHLPIITADEKFKWYPDLIEVVW